MHGDMGAVIILSSDFLRMTIPYFFRPVQMIDGRDGEDSSVLFQLEKRNEQ